MLCEPLECSPPGSSVHGISQAKTLEWVAISSSRGSSWPKDQTPSPVSPALQVDALWLSHQESTPKRLDAHKLLKRLSLALTLPSGKFTGCWILFQNAHSLRLLSTLLQIAHWWGLPGSKPKEQKNHSFTFDCEIILNSRGGFLKKWSARHSASPSEIFHNYATISKPENWH